MRPVRADAAADEQLIIGRSIRFTKSMHFKINQPKNRIELLSHCVVNMNLNWSFPAVLIRPGQTVQMANSIDLISVNLNSSRKWKRTDV